LSLAGCSVEKNSGSSRFYHALISKYNIYFNGNEAFKKGVEKVRTSLNDDYTNLLPVFEYSAPGSAEACTGDMERAIQKASKVIALHSITAKPEKEKKGLSGEKQEAFMKQKEYNVWVDDSYLLMAKAKFYQKNFNDTRTTISYLRDISTDQTILTEASIWYSRVLIEEKNYNLAEASLKEITDPEALSSDLLAMYSSTYADLLLRQKRYSEAVVRLEKAIESSREKNTRLRLTYLLAQVYQKEGNDAMSTKYFREVIRMNPPYELEFNAGVNLTGVADITSLAEAEDLKKILLKMLNDVKNTDYFDQIYYALGELSRRQGNIAEALENYRKSARLSSVNARQKGKSFLALGSYYFSIPDYVSASYYYDSASVIIDENYPDYKLIKERTTDLKEFITFHKIVVREDSLRRIASMTETERKAVIQNIIRDIKAEKQKEMMSGSRDMSNLGRSFENEQRYMNNISEEGSWYFYNQTALTFGRTEFKRRWGSRRLEDNWRRQNKSKISVSSDEDATTRGGQEGKLREKGEVPEDQTEEYYTRNLPLNDSLVNASIEKSTVASLNEGKVLSSRLRDTTMAIKAFEYSLNEKASSSTKAEALYNLYILQKRDNPAEANTRYNQLLSQFPESDYALVLSDPDYLKKQAEISGMCSALYNNAYYSFKQSAYIDAIKTCDEALVKYPDNELIPKFLLLKAMATGGLSGEFAYKTALDTLVARYPESPEGIRAKEISDFLKNEKPEIRIAEDTQIAETIYQYNPQQPHLVLILAANTSANINQIVFDVINYNLDNFQNKGYKSEGTMEKDSYLMITVSSFANADEAMVYLRKLQASNPIRGADKAILSYYVISRENLTRFTEDKNPERYRIFYEKNYVSQSPFLQ